MAEFLCLWAERDAFIDRLREEQREADAAAEKEAAAAVVLQRNWRGAVTRDNITTQLFACLLVQRVFRGHSGRRIVEQRRALVAREQERARLAFVATQVQRIVRGFLSRRLLLNFYKRREKVQQRHEAGLRLREETQRRLEQQVEQKRDEAETRARKAFAKASEGLHHLVSTRAQPGIYNPPYAASPADIPSAFNVPLETHLRDGSRRFIRTRGLSSQRWPRPLSRSEATAVRAVKEVGGETAVRALKRDIEALEAAGTLKPLRPGRSQLPRTVGKLEPAVEMAVTGGGAVSGAGATGVHGAVAVAATDLDEERELEAAAGMHGFEAVAARSLRRQRAAVPSKSGGAQADRPPPFVDNPRSLQASAPYGIEAAREREEARYRRLAELSATPFAAGGKVKEPKRPLGVAAGAPYDEPWKAARSTRELEHTAEAKALRVAPQAFVSTAGRVDSFEASERLRASGRVPSSQAWVTAGQGTGGQPGASLRRSGKLPPAKPARGGSASGKRRSGAAGGGAAAVRALQASRGNG
ncbi:hypothetical protein FNF28_00810 [Cafeteria roenbergensis]|uniref:Uncharacterized protein n=1 Tax=Cafeteria roenbergensis TaxID=33653 RepID=A0A5A8E1E6_CAFRO|nr:hypothetical protein FNF28_00810 [Cafeteria roenbergensis]